MSSCYEIRWNEIVLTEYSYRKMYLACKIFRICCTTSVMSTVYILYLQKILLISQCYRKAFLHINQINIMLFLWPNLSYLSSKARQNFFLPRTHTSGYTYISNCRLTSHTAPTLLLYVVISAGVTLRTHHVARFYFRRWHRLCKLIDYSILI